MIDVLSFGYYNVPMGEETVQILVAMETAEPKKRLNRSAGAIYVVLTALILAVISAANLLYAKWQVPRFLVQPPLYVLITIGALLIYRRHYVSFRYTLTDQTFAVERLTDGNEKAVVSLLLKDVAEIGTHPGKTFGRRVIFASFRPKKDSTAIRARLGEEEVVLWISPGETFLRKMVIQWQSVLGQNT
ncbi:MAG: hypothetical protein VB034_09315 [Eubacteriales bacterium]|nr:hypothetical protein [Eubacteriales bacterium]